ncbi:hypothetical protein [Nocardioides sp. B-3]|uniref:hypothetical protein n=1 Tax=Nocardioides sp. B-3 TaxID=2895565 RepID=UPI0021532312|nr:hypothetical protein [Nocardioides sp. B-3]UUZ60029.1 hypothetical protein LP418_03170 [Nocardioides sp. B-3]
MAVSGSQKSRLRLVVVQGARLLPLRHALRPALLPPGRGRRGLPRRRPPTSRSATSWSSRSAA